MEQVRAEAVTAELRQRGVLAHVHAEGVYDYRVRIVLPHGREALWDGGDGGDLSAEIMLDGILVGFVPTLSGTGDLALADVVRTIADQTYDAAL